VQGGERLSVHLKKKCWRWTSKKETISTGGREGKEIQNPKKIAEERDLPGEKGKPIKGNLQVPEDAG